jgi:hypothetical protein
MATVWRTSLHTGDIAVWYLNSTGSAIASGAVLGSSGVAWVAQAN